MHRLLSSFYFHDIHYQTKILGFSRHGLTFFEYSSQSNANKGYLTQQLAVMNTDSQLDG